MASSNAALVLDPYTCITKRNRKYASECREVYLANQGCEEVSEDFAHFGNLEVVWLSGNRLARIENLESNFRIKEVYIQDNRLVSLAGLRSFKFLKVLLASGNQLRNLEKQLNLLSHFAFLNKLDLFDNPVAEEPDYRLRLIYRLPQVEILDRHTVKGHERIRADEVVPNLDKVTASKTEKVRVKKAGYSFMERTCLQEASTIKECRRQDEEASLNVLFRSGIDKDTLPPDSRVFKLNREHWSDPRKKVEHEISRPTAWEQHALRAAIVQRAGKPNLTKADVERLALELATSGIQEQGRRLHNSNVFDPKLWQDACTLKQSQLTQSMRGPTTHSTEAEPHPMQQLLEDASANLPTTTIANWLLSLDWPWMDTTLLHRHMASKLHATEQYASDVDALAKNRQTVMQHALSLCAAEGATTRKHHVEVGAKDKGTTMLKTRTDIFPQRFLRATRQLDEATGRVVLKVALDTRSTSLGANH